MIYHIKLILTLMCLLSLASTQDCCEAEQQAINTCYGVGCYIPQCDVDCGWQPMQCWASTGYCWCVNSIGEEIDGTSIPSWQGLPDCTELNLECHNLDQVSCIYSEQCTWNTYTATIDCGSFNFESDCDEYSGCDWHCLGTMWGGQCLGIGYGCDGGTYEVLTGQCEDFGYLIGDYNGDMQVNILDIIEIIDLIVDAEYSSVADTNNDGELNVIDIIQIVDIIIN